MKPSNQLDYPQPTRNGFALVATISVMVLLVMVALAMLSLSTIELKSSTHEKAMDTARANARMALMIAIAELQKNLGPDQRVTAEADILDTSGFTGWASNASRKHYVGAYSTEEWHSRDASGKLEAWKPYDQDRNKEAFLRWLVSGTPQQVESLDFAKTQASTDSVELVGTGTLGSESDISERVRVPSVSLTDEDDKVTGKYAWWVGDEGIKAKVNLLDSRELPEDIKPLQRRLEAMNPSTLGINAITDFQNFNRKSLTDDDLTKIMTPNQLELLQSANLDKEAVRRRFHDFTTFSSGILADVSNGGLKRDLSIPFELPSLRPPTGATQEEGWSSYDHVSSDIPSDRHSSFHSIWEFGNSGDVNTSYTLPGNWGTFRPNWWGARMGYVFAYPKGSDATDRTGNVKYLRGPTWFQLRNHYRRYKRELEGRPTLERRGIATSDDETWLMETYQPFSGWHDSHGHTVLSRSYIGDSPNRGEYYRSTSLWDPFFSWEGTQPVNTMTSTSAGLVPVITKITMVLSYYIENDYGTKALRLSCDAVGTVWNPYNIPLETESLFTQVRLSGLRWGFKKKTASSETEESFGNGEPGMKDFPFEHFRIGACTPNAPGDRSRPNENIRLMPGEVRTFTMSNPEPENFDYGRRRVPFGAFKLNWEGGSFLKSSRWKTPGVQRFTFTLTPGIDPDIDDRLSGDIPGSNLSFQSFLGHFQTYKGDPRDPFDGGWNGSNLADMYEFMGVHALEPKDAMGGLDKFEVNFSNFSNMGPQNKRAFLAVELRRQATDTASTSMATQIDPRSIVNHTAAVGEGSHSSIPEGWEIDVKHVSDFSDIQVGVGPRSNGFFGSSHTGSGHSNIVFYEIPTGPSNSLGALQSAQLGVAGWDAPFTLGSSFAHPKITNQTELIKENSTNYNDIPFTMVYHDRAYLTNYNLWDKYFMSGFNLPANTSEDSAHKELDKQAEQFLNMNEPNPLTNRRLKLSHNARQGIAQDELVNRLTHYRWLARHLVLDGAFNINSTRVEAWKAWLSSLNTAELDKLTPQTGKMSVTTPENVPFPRHSIVTGDENELWLGFGSLTTSEIDKLATEIVKEVKTRGPFLSLSDFINRRLAADKTGEMGALQAALENAGLNTGELSEKGIPGTIRQGDILASLGNSITARSDTFTIRAYGEATDKKGRAIARAWCEAVVQRMPSPVNPQDSDKLVDMPNPDYPDQDAARKSPYIPNPEISDSTKKFGRRIQMISFRWMQKNEI